MSKIEELQQGVYVANEGSGGDALAVMLRKLLSNHPEDEFVVCQVILSREYAEKIIFLLSGSGTVN